MALPISFHSMAFRRLYDVDQDKMHGAFQDILKRGVQTHL